MAQEQDEQTPEPTALELRLDNESLRTKLEELNAALLQLSEELSTTMYQAARMRAAYDQANRDRNDMAICGAYLPALGFRRPQAGESAVNYVIRFARRLEDKACEHNLTRGKIAPGVISVQTHCDGCLSPMSVSSVTCSKCVERLRKAGQ